MLESLKSLIDDPDEAIKAWPQEPRLYRRDPASFRHLLTLEEVEQLVDAECLALRNVVLLKDSVISDPCRYGDEDLPGMPQRGAIRAHLNDGGTISLRGLERLKPAIAKLHAGLTDETGYRVHANAYLTPAGAQGIKYHFDPYLTLIVQLHGRKAWPVHEPFVVNPVREYGSFHLTGFTPEQRHFLEHTPPERIYTLEPGDVFWLPRGWLHSPYTVGDQPSLHITIAFKERTPHWAAQQLITEVLALALQDEQMRATLPPAAVVGDPRAAVQEAREYLIGSLMTADVEEMAELLRVAARRGD
ncbi:cupin domain-containing protein [Nonomuraea sp. NPDC000554]|uniref:JmjC domain-containing protein n=1 Tax=Nonomuraea sp. NPDC000554 TaxID=3154259 RepID=UPI00331DB2A5